MAVPQLGSCTLLRVRLVALGGAALPRRGQAIGRPATASRARASRLQSLRFHSCLRPSRQNEHRRIPLLRGHAVHGAGRNARVKAEQFLLRARYHRPRHSVHLDVLCAPLAHRTTAHPLPPSCAHRVRASARLIAVLALLLDASNVGERLGFCGTMLLSIQLLMIIVSDLVPSCGEMLWIDLVVRKPHLNPRRRPARGPCRAAGDLFASLCHRSGSISRSAS